MIPIASGMTRNNYRPKQRVYIGGKRIKHGENARDPFPGKADKGLAAGARGPPLHRYSFKKQQQVCVQPDGRPRLVFRVNIGEYLGGGAFSIAKPPWS